MHPVLAVLLGALTVTAAVYDFRFRRIPNALTMSGIAAGLLANTVLLHWGGTLLSLEGFGLASAIYVCLYALRGIGAGDVKLMAAIGAVAGPAAWFRIFLLTALAGALAAILIVMMRKRFRETFRNIGTILTSLVHFQRPVERDSRLDVRHPDSLRMPHGCAIGAGCVLYLCLAALR